MCTAAPASSGFWRPATGLAALLAMLGPTLAAGAPVHARDEVLVLHSYSQDFVWTASQQQGVEAVLGPLASEYDVRVEYLDAVHRPDLLKSPLLLDLLRAKLANQRFRVVLTSDNAALDFARAHRAELFPGVPIVFEGVNGYTDAMLRGETGITGVAEDSDLAGTLRVLLQLWPRTRRIVFPGMADDITYRAIRTTVAKDLEALPPGIETAFLEYPNIDAALEELRALPPDNAVVVMANMRTAAGEGISSQQVVELVSAAAPVPVFTNWDFTVGHGAVGGSVISGVEQGRLAAELAVRVLRGEAAESIPVHRGAGRTFLFDHRQLQRFRIPASRLPPGAVVLFAPERTFQVSREAASIAGVSFAALLGTTASLVVAVRRRRRAEVRLREANDQLQAVLEENRTLNRDLEARVAARTAELQTAKDEQESFTYSVSHDLRAPLRHIDGFVSLLRARAGGLLDEQSLDHLDAVASSARRMGALIDDLLAFSRTARRELSSGPVDLNAVAAEVVAELELEAKGRTVHWGLAELPVVAGDRAMLRQVLANLFRNALKFTRPRSVAEITLGWRPDGAEAVLFVRDNGVGFDPKYAGKLYGVFQRLHRSEEFEGTGIGLAMVRRIVTRHGGRVWAEGSVGKGAAFFFTLPWPAERASGLGAGRALEEPAAVLAEGRGDGVTAERAGG